MDKPPSIIWEKAVTSKQNFGKNKALSVQTEFSPETQVGEDTNVCGCVSYVLDTLILWSSKVPARFREAVHVSIPQMRTEVLVHQVAGPAPLGLSWLPLGPRRVLSSVLQSRLKPRATQIPQKLS